MRTHTCLSCGAAVARGYLPAGGQVILEPSGFGAMINSRGEARWGDTYREHACQPTAVKARAAWIESVMTTEQAIADEQREIAKQLALHFDCPKSSSNKVGTYHCGAKVGEQCNNLIIWRNEGRKQPTAWPHPERLALAEEAMKAGLLPEEPHNEEEGSVDTT